MRTPLILAALCLCGASFAERFIWTPTGGKLRSDAFRYEAFFEGSKSTSRYQWFGTGLGQVFDVEIGEERIRSGPSVGVLNFTYNFSVAIPDLAPGLSFGIQDVMNQGNAGRSAFGAITWRYNQYDPWNSDTPLDFTLGAGTGQYEGLFISSRLPLTNTFRLLVEHDSQAITFGMEIVPFHDARMMWLVREDRTFIGFRLNQRF